MEMFNTVGEIYQALLDGETIFVPNDLSRLSGPKITLVNGVLKTDSGSVYSCAFVNPMEWCVYIPPLIYIVECGWTDGTILPSNAFDFNSLNGKNTKLTIEVLND